MNVAEFANTLNLEIIAGKDGLNKTVKSGYCCDLLSWVMTRASEGDVWVTLMGNVNAVAVAVLTDVACIILADNSSLDKDAAIKADEQGIPILKSKDNQFDLCNIIGDILNK